MFLASIVFNFRGHYSQILAENIGDLVVVILKSFGKVVWKIVQNYLQEFELRKMYLSVSDTGMLGKIGNLSSTESNLYSKCMLNDFR